VQARAGQDVMTPGNRAWANVGSKSSNNINSNNVSPPRDSNIIKPDIELLRSIIQYLSTLEDKGAMTEAEVYKLERLVSVNKDQVGWACFCADWCAHCPLCVQLVLSYYMTFKDSEGTFIKKVRRHLQNLSDADIPK
jgi:hypothetical protein